jgi:hypothetical protein
VRYTIVVPDNIAEVIRSWNLAIDAEDLVYEGLEELENDPFSKCVQFPGPGPTLCYNFDFDDPLVLGKIHYLSVYLTLGPLENHLYVFQCVHNEREEWTTDEEADE